GAPIAAVEFGALDGMSQAEIAAVAPRPGEASLATRLKDGGEAVVSKEWAQGRLQQIFDRIDREGFDLLVLLCTGHSPTLHSRAVVVEARRGVDGLVDALAVEGCRLGVMVPLAGQVDEFHVRGNEKRDVRLTHFSPYAGDKLATASGLERATDDLAD